MIEIKTNKATLLIVDLPEGVSDISFTTGYLVVNSCTFKQEIICKLPEGEWQIIGKTFELTSIPINIIEEVIQRYDGYEAWFGYKDYTGKKKALPTPYDSLHSLLEANQVYKENPYGSHPSTWDYIDSAMHLLPKDIECWNKSQSRTMPNSVILKKLL